MTPASATKYVFKSPYLMYKSNSRQVDPRVDSDRYGAAGNTTGTHSSGLTGAGHSGSGLTGSNTHGTTSGFTGNNTHSGISDPTGPHDSRLGNQVCLLKPASHV
jgi:hypothetical protein